MIALPRLGGLRPFTRSLAARLVAGAMVWSLVILVVAAIGLSGHYRRSALNALDRELQVVLDALVAETRLDGAEVALTDRPNDPRFTLPQSGRYWQISPVRDGDASASAERSASLWDEDLPLPPGGVARLNRQRGRAVFASFDRGDERLRLAAQTVAFGDRTLVFTAAADRREALSDARNFTIALVSALAVLTLGLLAMAALQVYVGLSPLRRMQADIADVRRGTKPKLDGPYPTEVAPLAAELNALLAHNRAVVERARTQVGNLAHALKTPLSVLRNEAETQPGPLADLVSRQTEAMNRNVEHYLQQAQAAARAQTAGARCEAAPVLEDIARTLERLYGATKDVDIEIAVAGPVFFRGERQDLEEMAGNLMENACKYGRGRVRVSAALEPDPAWMRLEVEDDGPGLDPGVRAQALTRGERLDETAPGQGLGLSIVAELARLYGGGLELGEAPEGGLRASLRLPAAT